MIQVAIRHSGAVPMGPIGIPIVRNGRLIKLYVINLFKVSYLLSLSISFGKMFHRNLKVNVAQWNI